MVVAEEIIDAFTSAVGIGEIMKIKAFINKSNAMYFYLFFSKVSFKDQSVFPQNVVDAPHVFCGIFIFSVVEGVSAVVRTKFLIPASSQYMTAL
jgi:hypothetical protein